MTAERFVPDPFGTEEGARLYRTGDLARRLPDGALEFAGRADDQIKLRGFRIEVGEIEAVLGEHPAVEAACVVCREAEPGRRELVAYLAEDPAVAAQDERGAELRAELSKEWRTIFDETFREARPGPGTVSDTVGWKSSYTGAPLSAEEMAAWADASAARILALGPTRVLEVGCGTGLVLHRVAPRVARYVGLDFSAVVVEQLEAEVRARGLAGVHLERRDAADLAGLGERGFDVVVLNSVVQYLPSLDALLHVVTSALSLLADEGALFLGDVRSLAHLDAQHASVELFRAAPGASPADVRAAAERKRALEQELVLHPELFRTLPSRVPGVAGVEIHLRRGRHRNEMTKFHYDVVIRKGSPRPAAVTPARVEAAGSPDLRRILTGDAPDALLVTDLPDQRLADDLRVLRWLDGDPAGGDAAALRAEIAAQPAPGVDPEDVIALGESLGYAVSLSFAPGDAVGRFDALFVRRGVTGPVAGFPRGPAAPPARLANDPVAGRRERALVQSLRAHLEVRLPSYMIPASFVVLDALPLNPNGKIDRKALAARALPAPGLAGSDAGYRAPRDAVEETLAQVWARVLRLPRVGIHDNFFEIGGDSILSIQIVTRAQELGIALTPRQMFQHQTIAGLAAVASAAPAVVAEQGPVTGPAPLTPVQRWWLEQDPAEPHHFNQSLLVEVHAALDAAALERAVACLVGHHDALRLRLAGSGDDARMIFAEPGGPVPFARVDLGALPEAEQAAAVARGAAEAQASLDLSAGPILRVVLFDRGPAAPPLLLLVAHHLAVDAVSWSILLDDLWTAHEAARRGAPVALPRKTTSFKRWAERLAEHAGGSAARAELPLWEDPARREAAPIPVDHRTGPDDGASARHVVVSLSPEETERLLREAPSALRARVDELLLAAFAVALARWTGAPTVQLDLERHGREEIFPDVDLTRTIGWFTALVPIALRVGERTPRDAVAAVQRRLAELPHRGLGHGVLRHLCADTREALRALPAPEVCFNYLGQLDPTGKGAAHFVPVHGPRGEDRSPVARRTHLVEVNAGVAAGSFHATFTYGENRHARATIERVAASFLDAVRALLAEARPAPSAARIEDRYPLSPLQEGILFHARTAPSGDNVYLVQTAWTMEGDLDRAAFAAAVQDLADRHAVLRTAFSWEGRAAPEQIVHAGVAVPIEQRDLRALSPEDRAGEVERHAAAERARGFDLAVAPLMRVALLRLRDDAHRFIWTVHHVVLDGWSMPILLEELFALYEARCEGRALALDPPRPFRDYIDWLGQQDLAKSASFWRRELQGFVAATPLGVDHPPRDGGGPRAGVQRLSLDDEATEALVAFAQRRKLTLSTLVQGAWALLLSRYAGEDDVLFGAAVSGRSAKVPGVLRMVGLLINTLPVRVRAPLDARVEAWLADLQVHLAELREHEHSPLVDVMAQSDLPRGAPLFESLVVFENYPVPLHRTSLGGVPAQHGGLAITDPGHFDNPPYPLTLIAAHRGALHLELGHDRRRVDDDDAARMLGHFATLLAAFVAHPDAALRDLSILPPAERRRILAAGNDTAADYPRDACLHDLFEARAAAAPDAIALLFEGRAVSYRGIAARAHAVTRRLHARGVGRGARVGLFAERSPEAVAGILGVLAAGAAYVPLNPAYPHERLAFMIEDARLDVLLADARSAPRAPPSRAAVEPLDAPDAPGEAVISGVTAVEPAWVIYTSGSTGRPKGVVGSHRGVVNRCAWMWQRFPFRPGEVSCHRTTLSFSDSLWEIFGPLLQGVPSLVLPDARVHDLSLFLGALRDARVSRLVVVPSLLRALLDVAPDLGARLPDLAIVVTSGEALPPDLAARFHRAMPGRTLLNIYGSTEVSADATWAEVPDDPGAGVTIGVPIANTRAHVLDAAGHPAPFGVPGELAIGGDAVTLGYLDRPDLTAERFVRDPFSEEPGARLFRTGDRVRRRASGEIEILGRRDDQVKVRGVRVELGDVRAALLDHPEVREAAVVARPDARGELRLVAYVVARGAEAPKAGDLAAFLRDRLPAPEVPSAYVPLDALPHLPNGKLDRRALPAPEAPSGAAGHVAPRDAVEEQIAAIWAEVLGIDRVSVVAGFFELGGHSLLLARAHDRLAAHFGRPIALVDSAGAPDRRRARPLPRRARGGSPRGSGGRRSRQAAQTRGRAAREGRRAWLIASVTRRLTASPSSG
ncbi:MAG: amino acid adenylation domain-containing protein [Minicystis sp.]